MIDTQAIRKKILDLALRGKLTEQRPEDGTAEELFQQIQAQKNTYIANKDTKKANVSVPISDGEVPFNKPESWKWVRLGEIVIIKTGKRDANFGSINGKYREFMGCSTVCSSIVLIAIANNCLAAEISEASDMSLANFAARWRLSENSSTFRPSLGKRSGSSFFPGTAGCS